MRNKEHDEIRDQTLIFNYSIIYFILLYSTSIFQKYSSYKL